jgi:hypothetical protein
LIIDILIIKKLRTVNEYKQFEKMLEIVGGEELSGKYHVIVKVY